MKGYVSKLDKATSEARSYGVFIKQPHMLNNVIRQIFAKMIVGRTTTIGKVKGKFVLDKEIVLKKPCLPK